MARPLLDMLATALQVGARCPGDARARPAHALSAGREVVQVNAVAYDYPGYGPRRDPRILPSEQGAYAALAAVLGWLERELQIPRSRVVLCVAWGAWRVPVWARLTGHGGPPPYPVWQVRAQPRVRADRAPRRSAWSARCACGLGVWVTVTV
jgi:hypothetical protein